MGETEDYSKSATPTAHKTSHQDGGTDEIGVTGLSGLLADAQTPLAHKASHQDGGADEISVTGLSGLLADAQTPLAHKASHEPAGSDELTAFIKHALATAVNDFLIASGVGVFVKKTLAETKVILALPKFSAHKNGTDQTGIVDATPTKVTFTTEEYDEGSAYDAPNSKWVPGIIGKAHVSASCHWFATVDQKMIEILVYKNGAPTKQKRAAASGTGDGALGIDCDVLVGAVTDYFEIYVTQWTGASQDIYGASPFTFFQGHMLL